MTTTHEPPLHWGITHYHPEDGHPVADSCDCEIGYHHRPDGTPDPDAPAGEVPHEPDAVEIIPTHDAAGAGVSARCLTCKGLLGWRRRPDRADGTPAGGWHHLTAPWLDLVRAAS